jgi:serine phosphatase RsbU (regulator of sigma subunit)/anti-sigma regulatory factor (Ser/Thr protein kinase)
MERVHAYHQPMPRVTETPAVLAALQRVTDAALAYLPLDELLNELLVRIADIIGSDTAAFLLLEDNGQMLLARAAKGIEEEVEQGVRIPVGRGFAGRIAAERRAIFIPDVDHADILNPILRERGIRSLLGVPLLVEGRVIGVMHVGTLTPREFTAADRELLQLAADRAAMAIDHASNFYQRRVVDVLQRSLVPEELPSLPGLELAARYRPAAVRGGIGGDWYDVFPLTGGYVALVIGDVMGHGIGAAALMAQIRTGLRAYALDGHEPAGVAERLNRLSLTLGPTQMTTFAYALLNLDECSGCLVSAGHVPPLIKHPDGSTVVLEVEGDPPLGVSTVTRYREHMFELPPGATVVLVTDGAVEVRGEPIDAGLSRLAQLVSESDDLEELCSAIVGGDARGRSAEDDVAVLAARMLPLPERLTTRWTADPGTLAAMRPLLRRWLAMQGADDDEIYDITVAVQEASANAVEHAYGPGAATFDIDAVLQDGAIAVTIRDRGHWRPPRGTHRGRGLSMMRALMDSVDVQRNEHGTTVVLRRALGRE